MSVSSSTDLKETLHDRITKAKVLIDELQAAQAYAKQEETESDAAHQSYLEIRRKIRLQRLIQQLKDTTASASLLMQELEAVNARVADADADPLVQFWKTRYLQKRKTV